MYSGTPERDNDVKTIGVLGGISPQATMDFETRLHHVAQRLIPQHGNSGYPGLMVYYHRRPPVVTRDGIVPVLPLQADPELLEAARWLGSRADFLVIISNGAHALQDAIERAAGRNVLSMVEETLKEVRRRGWRRVGVLGFPDLKVPIYTQPLQEAGTPCELIGDDLQPRLNAAILALMEGKGTSEAAQDAVAALRRKGVDGTILGCTEIPLLLPQVDVVPTLINPAQLLAEAAVRAAQL